MSYDINLEQDFLETNKKSGKFTVICGRKGSGKSYLATNYIAISYTYNVYDEYFFVFPEFSTDANSETYKFINGHPNTTIYNTYDKSITMKVKETSKNKKILYVLDDATSYLFENKNKAELLNLFTTCRHGRGITIIVICHALKSVLVPSIRGMIDFMFIGAFTNYTIIKKHLYEENCSMMISEKEFMDEYKHKIVDEEHNFLFINGRCQFAFDVNEWILSKFDRNLAISKKKEQVKIVNFDHDRKIKDKIKEKKHVSFIENQMFPKTKK